MAGLFELLAKCDDSECSSAVLQDESSSRYSNSEGLTLLHVAASKGYISTVRSLLALKANVNARAHSGTTPLIEACKSGQMQIAEMLAGVEGIEFDLQDGQGQTALHWAGQSGAKMSKVTEILFERGASVNVDDVFSRTPFHWICHKGDVKLVQCAVERFGADPRLRSQGGDAALHWACSGNSEDVVAYLLTLDSVDAAMLNNAGESAANVSASESIRSSVLSRIAAQAADKRKAAANVYAANDTSGGESIFERRETTQQANKQAKKMTIKLRK